MVLKTNSNVSFSNIISAPSYKAIIKNMFIFTFNIIIETQAKKFTGDHVDLENRKIFLKNSKDLVLKL